MRRSSRYAFLAFALLLLPLPAAPAAAPAAAAEAADTADWGRLAGPQELKLPPDTLHRVGFDVPAGDGRVAVCFRARATGEEPHRVTGYSPAVVIEVNGERLSVRLAGRGRLLNKPGTFRLADGRELDWAIPGRWDTIREVGSARWFVPLAPSLQAAAAHERYGPQDLQDPFYYVVEITDLVYPGRYNFIDVKNELDGVTAFVTDLTVISGGRFSRPEYASRARRAAEALQKLYMGPRALPRRRHEGRKWVHDMQLASHYGSVTDSLSELRTIEDARRLVAAHKKAGFTAIILNGLHMRMDFQDLRESRLLPYYRLLIQAAREAEMPVINHHDVPIVYLRGYRFLDEQGQAEWLQRDVRYGRPARMFCLNNPDFRENYFSWLRRVQAEAPFDAYMLDELYFFDDEFCGCEHCRRLFRRDTGLELPTDPHDPAIGNDADPLWQLFGTWKRVCRLRFRKDALEAMRAVTPEVFLVGYSSNLILPNARGAYWGDFFDTYATGVEAMSRVPFKTFRGGFSDLLLRRGAAEAFETASWAIPYPKTPPTIRFAWALCEATGNACWWSKATDAEAAREQLAWDRGLKKNHWRQDAQVGIVFSRSTRDASLRNGIYHALEAFGWSAALLAAGVQFEWVLEPLIDAETLERYDVLILPECTGFEQIAGEAYRAFVRGGGTLVVSGRTGLWDPRGRPERDFRLADLTGVHFAGQFGEAPFEVRVEGFEPFTLDTRRCLYRRAMRFLRVKPEDDVKVVGRFVPADGVARPGLLERRVGAGRVYTFAGSPGSHNYASNEIRKGGRQIFRFNADAEAFLGRWVRSLLGCRERIVPRGGCEGLVWTAWREKSGEDLAIQILDVGDHVRVMDENLYPREEPFEPVDRPVTFFLRDLSAEELSATIDVPGRDAPRPCGVFDVDGGCEVTIPADSFTMYGLLKIHRKGRP